MHITDSSELNYDSQIIIGNKNCRGSIIIEMQIDGNDIIDQYIKQIEI